MEKRNLYATRDKPWLKFDYPNGLNLDNNEIFKSANQFLWEHCGAQSSDIALEWFDKKISFYDLRKSIQQTARALTAYGVKKNDIITVCSVCTPEIVYLFYALDLIGALGNMVDPRTSVQGLKEYIEEVDSKFVVSLDIAYPKIKKAVIGTNCKDVLIVSPADSLPPVKKVAYKLMNRDKNDYDSNVVMWKEFYEKGFTVKKSFYGDNFDPQRGLLIVHTGGTTGKPKGVLLSAKAINAVSYQCDVFSQGIGSKWLNVMPPFIAYGFCAGIHAPLTHGITSIIIPNLDPKELGSLYLKHKPNYMAGAPIHYETLIRDPKVQKADLSFMKFPALGGDAMSIGNEIEVNNFLKAHGIPGVIKGYGMTEVAALCCASSLEHIKQGAVGYPMGLTTIACFEPGTDIEVPLGQEGEVCITGPSLMLGYYNNQEETDNVMKKHSDGQVWVHSGDIGVMDEDGYLFIKSRIKRVIIRHDGFKIFNKVIEDAISKHPLVKEISAVAVKDVTQLQGNTPIAYFTLKDTNKTKEEVIEEVKQLCENEIPEYCLPTYYEVIDSMPYTGIGKINYRELELKAERDHVK